MHVAASLLEFAAFHPEPPLLWQVCTPRSKRKMSEACCSFSWSVQKGIASFGFSPRARVLSRQPPCPRYYDLMFQNNFKESPTRGRPWLIESPTGSPVSIMSKQLLPDHESTPHVPIRPPPPARDASDETDSSIVDASVLHEAAGNSRV